jgi:hypothetical protein
VRQTPRITAKSHILTAQLLQLGHDRLHKGGQLRFASQLRMAEYSKSQYFSTSTPKLINGFNDKLSRALAALAAGSFSFAAFGED